MERELETPPEYKRFTFLPPTGNDSTFRLKYVKSNGYVLTIFMDDQETKEFIRDMFTVWAKQTGIHFTLPQAIQSGDL